MLTLYVTELRSQLHYAVLWLPPEKYEWCKKKRWIDEAVIGMKYYYSRVWDIPTELLFEHLFYLKKIGYQYEHQYKSLETVHILK